MVVDWSYSFKVTNNLEATFRGVFIQVALPNTAFEIFHNIIGTWQVEEHTGALVKEHFIPSESMLGYYTAKADITKHMWKDNVPQEITIEVVLAV